MLLHSKRCHLESQEENKEIYYKVCHQGLGKQNRRIVNQAMCF